MLLIIGLILSVKAVIFNETSSIQILSSQITRVDSREFDKSTNLLHNLKQSSVGQNCGALNKFNTSYVIVDPYPITPGAITRVIQHGHFLQNMFIQENVFGTCYNEMIWNYQPIDINKMFRQMWNIA